MGKKKSVFGGIFKGKKDDCCCNFEIVEDEETEEGVQRQICMDSENKEERQPEKE
ncbi:hypothetical protein OBO34_11335 [Clostridiales Family XIII bacterium ASD5510]|uniref:Uncharacterized protein n=1 Tax=Hominibacterium faecale TaxID=2839743 RepID=A0A9J6QSF5_9FIRM|nr:hypothetical protein [Hominibacterium faecale]MCU7378949.1 hypothetical protein [Hominibacterium faecale]